MNTPNTEAPTTSELIDEARPDDVSQTPVESYQAPARRRTWIIRSVDPSWQP